MLNYNDSLSITNSLLKFWKQDSGPSSVCIILRAITCAMVEEDDDSDAFRIITQTRVLLFEQKDRRIA